MSKISYAILIILYVIAVVGMSLYPPFIATPGTGVTLNMGYHYILEPPTKICLVNVTLLLTQAVMATLVTVALWLLKSKEEEYVPVINL